MKEHKQHFENYKGFAPVREFEETIIKDFKDIVDNSKKDESIAELLDDVLTLLSNTTTKTTNAWPERI
jgi:hypothetical protein